MSLNQATRNSNKGSLLETTSAHKIAHSKWGIRLNIHIFTTASPCSQEKVSKAAYVALHRTSTWSTGKTAKNTTGSVEKCLVHQSLLNSNLGIQPKFQFPQPNTFFSFCKTVTVLQTLKLHWVFSANIWHLKAWGTLAMSLLPCHPLGLSTDHYSVFKLYISLHFPFSDFIFQLKIFCYMEKADLTS